VQTIGEKVRDFMAIRKRGDSWQIDYLDPTGSRVRKSFKKKKDAVAELGKRVNTGMRRGEILTLRWNQVRNGFIYLEKTKTKNRREIPINADFSEVLDQIRREHVKREKNFPTDEYVFLYGSRHIKRLDRAFQGALKNAQIEDFRFHDLRHCFASHLVMRGASLKEVQELLGHKTMTMTLRYAHLSQENKKKAVNLLNGLTAPVEKAECHKTVTFPNSAVFPTSQVPEITGRGERI
jgi:integrase